MRILVRWGFNIAEKKVAEAESGRRPGIFQLFGIIVSSDDKKCSLSLIYLKNKLMKYVCQKL